MKILATINCFTGKNSPGGNLVFALAWKNFLDKHRKEINIDTFLFVNNGFDQNEFINLLDPYSIYTLSCAAPQPFDTETTFWPIYHNALEYDFVIRIDHDAFPDVTTLNNLADYIRKHPELDFASASNFPRPIEHDRTHMQLDNRFIPLDQRKEFQWAPWGYPTHNSDLFIMRTQFFKSCLNQYQRNSTIQAGKSYIQCPFHTSVLNFGQICRMLDYKGCPQHTEYLNVHIDGSINSDFWTIMCQRKMKAAGIVDYNNQSFRAKNHLQHYDRVLALGGFDQTVDDFDTSFPHVNNIQAPYFHLGNGYLSEWYFSPFNNPNRESFDYFANHFKADTPGFYAVHYIFVKLLTLSSGNSKLINQLTNSMNQLISSHNINLKKLEEMEEKIKVAYKTPLKPFLREGIL